MEFDEIQAEIFLLLNQMENQPEDRFGLYLKLQEKLRQMQAFGMTPPEDLVALVNELDAEFTAEARSGDIRSASRTTIKSDPPACRRKTASGRRIHFAAIASAMATVRLAISA